MIADLSQYRPEIVFVDTRPWRPWQAATVCRFHRPLLRRPALCRPHGHATEQIGEVEGLRGVPTSIHIRSEPANPQAIACCWTAGWILFPRGIRSHIRSPALHHIHHSKNPKHFDKNFARVFTF